MTNQRPSSACAVRSGRSRYPENSTGPAILIRPSGPMSTDTPSSGTPSYTQPPQVSVIP